MKRDKISSSISRSCEDGRSKKTESVPFRCHLLVPAPFYSYTWSRDGAAPGANFHVLLLENLDEAVESGFLDLRRDGASMSDHHADADDVDVEQLLAGAITERSARNPGCWRQCSVRPEDASVKRCRGRYVWVERLRKRAKVVTSLSAPAPFSPAPFSSFSLLHAQAKGLNE